jgi:hypothetical protein
MKNVNLSINTRVQTIMGCRLVGTVVSPMSPPFTDGQYRQPEGFEKREAVYVRWDDNTYGWIHRALLQVL